ncbi:MAG: RelA/SpoT domain-containing protein [Cyclobacteriaceae bacterium]
MEQVIKVENPHISKRKTYFMAFASVPSESKRALNRAAQEMVDGNISWERIELVNKWRACHAYPLNTFQSTLRGKLKNYSDSIAAQRLKRLVTIVGKLRDDPRLTLTTMQDIGGVRAILKSIKHVNKLTQEYLNSPYFVTMIEENACKNYILAPKPSGYRGIHLIFRVKNKKRPSYDGLRIEMQIRTKLQHIWATSVEVMGTFRGEKLKSGKGDDKWQEFFALVSSYFAYQENSQPVFPELTLQETIRRIIEIEAEISAIDIMNGFTLVAKDVHEKGADNSYYLIVLDSKEQRVSVTTYERGDFNAALKALQKIESSEGSDELEAVLVASGKIENLTKAYPNYFLDTTEFVKELWQIKLAV